MAIGPHVVRPTRSRKCIVCGCVGAIGRVGMDVPALAKPAEIGPDR